MRVTASKAGLLAGCQWWAREGVSWEEKPGASAVAGNKFHQLAEAYLYGAETPVKVPKPLSRAWDHARDWIDAMRKPTMHAEMAYAYDPETGGARCIGQIGRAYPPDVLCGTADIVDSGETLTICDWKTGRSVARVWPQMRTLGLMAARAHGRNRVRLVVLHATADGVIPYSDEMGAMDLDGEAALLRERVAAIASSEQSPGEHCWADYCPARHTCRAYQDRYNFGGGTAA